MGRSPYSRETDHHEASPHPHQVRGRPKLSSIKTQDKNSLRLDFLKFVHLPTYLNTSLPLLCASQFLVRLCTVRSQGLKKTPIRIDAPDSGTSNPATFIFLHGFGDDADGLISETSFSSHSLPRAYLPALTLLKSRRRMILILPSRDTMRCAKRI
jgi:hypothetical protein